MESGETRNPKPSSRVGPFKARRRGTLFAITFDVADEDALSARVSAVHPRCRVLERPATGSEVTETARFVTIFGVSDASDDWARRARLAHPEAVLETVATRPAATTFLYDPGRSAAVPPDLRMRIHDAFKGDVFIEPVVASGGELRVRILVPPSTPQAAARAAIHAAAGGRAWRLLAFEPHAPNPTPPRLPLLDVGDEALLRIAYAFGHYTSPKGATLETIARHVGLTTSPLHKRLAAAERTVVEAALDPAARGAEPRARSGLGNGTTLEARFRLTRFEHPLARLLDEQADLVALVLPSGNSLQAAVLGPAGARAGLLEKLRSELPFELVAAGDAHDMIRIGPGTHGSLAAFASRFGPDAFLRPSGLKGGVLDLRLVLVEALGGRHLDLLLSAATSDAPCARAELLAWRAGTVDLPPVPPPRQGALTARQEQVLRVAHALGYYRSPRGATLAKVAATLGISTNAAHKSLTSAEEKLISAYLATPL